MAEKYQLFDPLRPEEYAALKADIDKHGVLVPVELDQDGNILDGHNRAAIAAELGREYPTVVRSFASEAEKREHVLKINLLRRHLGPVAWANGFRQLCEARGVQVGPGRPRLDGNNGPTVGQLAAELGVPRATAYRRLDLADKLSDVPDLAARVDSGEMTPKRAQMVKRKRDAATVPEEPQRQLTEALDLRPGDFRDVLASIPDASVDLIFTDPPYPAEYLPLWSDLALFAARVLKPGRLMVAYSGQYHLLAVLKALTDWRCPLHSWNTSTSRRDGRTFGTRPIARSGTSPTTTHPILCLSWLPSTGPTAGRFGFCHRTMPRVSGTRKSNG